MLSEAVTQATSEALKAVAQLAPTLGEAQLRVLIALTAKAQPPWWTVKASSRQLAKETKCSRGNIQAAIDELSRRNIIATREGSPTSASAYMLVFARAIVLKGGPAVGPPQPEQVAPLQGQVALFQGQGGPISGPPGGPTAGPPHNKERDARAPGSIDRNPIDINQSSNGARADTIDAILRAKPSDHPNEDLEFIRRHMVGYQAKFPPANWDGGPGVPNATPPDDTIAAQILAIASPRQFQELITTLAQRRTTPGYEWPWFVTVTAQRIHGIKPAQLAARRKGLRIERRPPAPAQPQLYAPEAEAHTALDTDTHDFAAELADTLRKVKSV